MSMSPRLLFAGLGCLLALTACEEKSSNKLQLGAQSTGDCALSLDTLDGSTWVIEKINADKSVEPDHGTRLKFVTEEGELKAKYNVGSLSDMYTYECMLKGEGDTQEMDCRETPKLKDWCQSLMVAEGSECTAEKLKEISDGRAADEDIAKAITEATATVEKWKDKPEWKQFVFNNNNLGNKLQGRIYARVNKRKCNLTITDMYMTLYNGKVVEDSNPVGTNAFLTTDEALTWKHCTDSGDLYPRKTTDFPEKEEDIKACYPNQGCFYSSTDTAYFDYLGQDGLEAKEGCTYSYDIDTNGKPVSQDNTAEVVDYKGAKQVRWHYEATYAEPGNQVVLMTRYSTCEGKKEELETSCGLVVVK